MGEREKAVTVVQAGDDRGLDESDRVGKTEYI